MSTRKRFLATERGRLARIAEIIEAVDNRCMAADGPVTPTLSEMTQAEISEIYKLASKLPTPPRAPQEEEDGGDDPKLAKDAWDGGFAENH